MPASKNNFLDHVRWLRKAVGAAGAEALIAIDSCEAFIRHGGAHRVLYPQFQATVDGQLQYQRVLTDDAWMFAGWLPYRLRRWETAVDKLAFKRYAQSVGLPVPRYWLGADGVTGGVVIKRPASSFGAQVDGPYRNAADRPLDLALGEFYEEFIEGRLLKIWYLEARPICAEIDTMPCVWGDGSLPVSELIVRRASQHRPLAQAEKQRLLARSEPVVRYFAGDMGRVLGKGVRQTVEFRYGSSLMRAADRSVIGFDDASPCEWLPQASAAGEKIHAAIPAQIRENAIYTVDGVLTREGEVKLLEVNCNPTVHPLVYPPMLEQLLQSRSPALAAAVA